MEIFNARNLFMAGRWLAGQTVKAFYFGCRFGIIPDKLSQTAKVAAIHIKHW
jgi:hypothetical protein